MNTDDHIKLSATKSELDGIHVKKMTGRRAADHCPGQLQIGQGGVDADHRFGAWHQFLENPAIAAAKLGADSVLALDADPQAVEVAQENVEMNGVTAQVTVQHGSLPGGGAVPRHFRLNGQLELLDSGHFDLVLVNILAPVIVGMIEALASRMKPEGELIAAGLIVSQEGEVLEAFRSQGLKVAERAQEKDWISLVAKQG